MTKDTLKIKPAWILILMSIAITFLITIQAVTHVEDERSRADVNQDGIINILDLVIVAKYLGKQEAGGDKEPMSTSVNTEQPPVEPPMPETQRQETVYPEVTHANALELKRGETYRMRPSGYSGYDNAFGDSVIADIHWGTVDLWGQLHKGVSQDDPKTQVIFNLRDKNPYSQTLDGKPVIDSIEQDDGTFIYDEILIRIASERIQVIGVEHPTKRTGDPEVTDLFMNPRHIGQSRLKT